MLRPICSKFHSSWLCSTTRLLFVRYTLDFGHCDDDDDDELFNVAEIINYVAINSIAY